MNDTIGLVYDNDTAVHFIATTTGIHAADAERILRAKDEYQLGLEILPEGALGENVSAEAIRAVAPALFNPGHIARRFLSPPIERAFIVMRTSLDESVVRTALDADEEYMRRVGIIGEVSP